MCRNWNGAVLSMLWYGGGSRNKHGCGYGVLSIGRAYVWGGGCVSMCVCVCVCLSVCVSVCYLDL